MLEFSKGTRNVLELHKIFEYSKGNVNLSETFSKNLSADLNRSKAKICKIIQLGEFLRSLLSKLAGPLMKVAIPLVKNALAPLGITAATSAIDAGIQKKIHGSGTTTLIISNEKMNDIMKIVQALEVSNIKLILKLQVLP